MKLLHTSDWHLGITFKGISAEDDQQFFIDQICRIAEERKIDGILLAGDVFDRRVAGGEVVSFYDRTITGIVLDLGVPVYCVAGNHDSAERLSQCSELLKKSGLWVAGSLSRDVMKAECGDADIYLVPWFTPEKVRAVFSEHGDEIKTTEDAWRVVTAKIRESFRPGVRHILVTHAYIIGAETSVSDRAAEIGYASAVGKGVFEGFDYVALGHIHKAQVISPEIRYSGTPMPYSFGAEEEQTKGVVIIDTEDMSQEFVPLELLHRRTTLRGSFEELMKGDADEDIRNGYLRLELSDSYAGASVAAMLQEVYPNIIDIKGKDLDPDSSGISLTIEDLEEISSDPVELFRRYCEDNNLECTDLRIERFREAVAVSVKEEM